VRTSISLDDNVVRLLVEESRRSGASIDEVVNYLVRLGSAAAKDQVREPLVVSPSKVESPAEKSYDNIEALLDDLEDQAS
jgi:hypothetical protein